MSSKVSRLTIDLPSTAHRRMKTMASMLDMSMKDLVLMSVDEFMHRKPNKVTEKALKQSQIGKNLKKFESIDAMFEDLGI
jgi:hypothetical protein